MRVWAVIATVLSALSVPVPLAAMLLLQEDGPELRERGLGVAAIFLLSFIIGALVVLHGALATTLAAWRLRTPVWIALASFHWVGLVGCVGFVALKMFG